MIELSGTAICDYTRCKLNAQVRVTMFPAVAGTMSNTRSSWSLSVSLPQGWEQDVAGVYCCKDHWAAAWREKRRGMPGPCAVPLRVASIRQAG